MWKFRPIELQSLWSLPIGYCSYFLYNFFVRDLPDQFNFCIIVKIAHFQNAPSKDDK